MDKVVSYLELNKKNNADNPDLRKVTTTLMKEQMWSVTTKEMKLMKIPRFDM